VVLVDTSLWVSHFRRGNPSLVALLNDAQVMTHDFIVGELACGNLKARKEILSLLRALPCAPVVSQEELLYFIEERHLVGMGIGFVDAHLLASANLMGVSVWSLDRRLHRAAAKLDISYYPAR
jgi:predicted nucleic acid-binding protein